MIAGAKIDPLFFFAPQEIKLNFGPFKNSRVYFNQQDGAFQPLISGENDCAFSEPDECVESQYVDKTNTQLNALYNNSFLGSITPSTATNHPMVVGGKVADYEASSKNVSRPTPCAIYPNPTYGKLTVPDNYRHSIIEVISVDGILWQELEINVKSAEVDLFVLPAGVYVLRMRDMDNGNACFQRIVKVD